MVSLAFGVPRPVPLRPARPAGLSGRLDCQPRPRLSLYRSFGSRYGARRCGSTARADSSALPPAEFARDRSTSRGHPTDFVGLSRILSARVPGFVIIPCLIEPAEGYGVGNCP